MGKHGLKEIIYQTEMINIVCGNCSHPYPEEGVPYCCDKCGGVYRFTGEFNFDNSLIDLS